MESILAGYLGETVQEKSEEGKVKQAVPQIYDYRERFKKRQLTPDDVVARRGSVRIQEFGQSEFNDIDRVVGRGTFFGPGTEIDI